MKRITWWPQAWLGLVFSWGALVGWPAVRGTLDWPALLLWFGSIAWVVGYDTLYAIQDIEDDALVGVKSSARRLGDKAPLGVAIFYALAMLLWGGGDLAGPAGLAGAGRAGSGRDPPRQPGASGRPRATASSRCGCSARTAPPVASSFSPCWSSDFPAARRSPCFPSNRPAIAAQSLVERGARRRRRRRRCRLRRLPNPRASRCGLGELEHVDRSEGEEMGLRVFVGQRSASVASSDFSARSACESWSTRCWRWPREAPEDPYAGLAPAELLERGALPDIESEDRDRTEPESLRAPRAGSGASRARRRWSDQFERRRRPAHRPATMALATSAGFSARLSLDRAQRSAA